MKILEISKKYIDRFYDNNINLAIERRDGIIWDDKRIENAFNYGHGKSKDFYNYMKNNKEYCIYVLLEG